MKIKIGAQHEDIEELKEILKEQSVEYESNPSTDQWKKIDGTADSMPNQPYETRNLVTNADWATIAMLGIGSANFLAQLLGIWLNSMSKENKSPKIHIEGETVIINQSSPEESLEKIKTMNVEETEK